MSNNLRNYKDASTAVKIHYRKLRQNQTHDYVLRMKKKYLQFDTPLTLWDALDKVKDFVDTSDPDLEGVGNIHHNIQTAEALRKAKEPDWMQLVGLIHDLGKVMYLKGCDEDGTSEGEQWGLVGDTFVVGCDFPDKIIYPEYNRLNPDTKDVIKSSFYGVYSKHCGLDRCHMSWGHDEYLYQVLKNHKGCKLPEEALYIIRYHSLYPWHQHQAYKHLANDKDNELLPLLQGFNHYDLYTKCEKQYKLTSALKKYYQKIIDKYFDNDLIMW